MDKSKRTKLKLNTLSSLLLYLITFACGFILPKLILNHYGSKTNGIVSSITQFLSLISFLELGVGSVVQSSLYKPLSEKNELLISQIIRSASRFYRKIAIILVVYVIILVFVYPILINGEFDFVYTAVLIVSISISLFAQYYFGVVDSLLLTADQRGYIQYNTQTITLILNTIVSIILIEAGASIQLVKLSSSLIYLLRPIILRQYVKKHYLIDRKVEYEIEPIKQKWNGVAQHVSAVVLDQTDVIVLTTFSTLSSVSVYNVYHLVVFGIKSLVMYMTSGISALLGEYWARQELDNLKSFFIWSEWTIHTIVVFVFGCTASLIVPFIQIYTKGVNDANYYVPMFALLITIANAMHCLRLPYNLMILAGGHYKQTQSNYIISALINIIVSIVAVRLLGLVGVAIGTIAAMAYQTIWMAWYNSKNFLKIPIVEFFKHMTVDILSFIIAFTICRIIHLESLSLLSWVFLAIKHAIIWIIIIILCNLLCYRVFLKEMLLKVKKK